MRCRFSLASPSTPARWGDVEEELLSVARLQVRSARTLATLVCGDVRALPFSTGSFDVVIDFGRCYHIPRAADALDEIARVIAPGGLFVHETRIAQLFAHPIRSRRARLPWSAAPSLAGDRHAMLWARRIKTV